jgi:hypothetical protein
MLVGRTVGPIWMSRRRLAIVTFLPTQVAQRLSAEAQMGWPRMVQR